MLVALLGFNVVHPGRIMRGKEYDMPSAWKQGRRYREMDMQPVRSEVDGIRGKVRGNGLLGSNSEGVH